MRRSFGPPLREVKGEVGARLQLAYALCAVEGGDLSTARDALSQAESLLVRQELVSCCECGQL